MTPPSPRTRARRGGVTVYVVNGILKLNCTYNGRRIRQSTGLPANSQNRLIAENVASTIALDLALGHFQGDLKIYLNGCNQSSSTLEIYRTWVDYLSACNVPRATLDGRCRDLGANLGRWGKQIQSVETAADFLRSMRSRQSPSTTNAYLAMLRRWGAWCEKKGYWAANHFEPIRRFPGARSAAHGDPFTLDEIDRILAAMAAIAPHYVPFAYFLFATGARPSEAIALRWADIDLEAGTVKIAASMTRGRGRPRERKGTKTEAGTRILPLSENLKRVLRGHRPRYCHPDRLAFPAPQGGPIDCDNYRNRAWKTALAAAGVAYRKPYFTRHTFASQALSQGATVPQAAAMLGHANSRMVNQTYGRATGAIVMPTFPSPILSGTATTSTAQAASQIRRAAKVTALER